MKTPKNTMSPALLIFICVCNKAHNRGDYQPTPSEISTWIETAQNACELTDQDIAGEAGLYRLAAEYSLCAEAYERHCEEEAQDYRSVYG